MTYYMQILMLHFKVFVLSKVNRYFAAYIKSLTWDLQAKE